MNKKELFAALCLIVIVLQTGCQNQLTELKGEYLGQKKPGLIPELFAPNFIGTEYFEGHAFFHPNGKEFYNTAEGGKYEMYTIMFSKIEGEKWSKPQPLPIPTKDGLGSFITSDGLKFYYSTVEPVNENSRPNPNIWVMEREGESWGDPRPLEPAVNTIEGGEWFPSVADNGTLYFNRANFSKDTENIYYTASKNGTYQTAKLFEASFNTQSSIEDSFIAPNESYILLNADSSEGTGFYVSFRDAQGKWSALKDLGIKGGAPSLSPDGKFLFFGRGGNIYWVDAQIIENLR